MRLIPRIATRRMQEAACRAWYGCADWREKFYIGNASQAEAAMEAMRRAYAAMIEEGEAEWVRKVAKANADIAMKMQQADPDSGMHPRVKKLRGHA